MGKAPRPFEITLSVQEAAQIMGPAGDGGHQDLHEKLNEQLENGNLTIKLTDAELGMVIRYMTPIWQRRISGPAEACRLAVLPRNLRQG